MIKKASNIAIIMLLLVSTSGMTIYKHYCNGQLISESISHKAKDCCGDHCKACHNESTFLKILDNFDVSHFTNLSKITVKEIPCSLSFDLPGIYDVLITLDNHYILLNSCDFLHFHAQSVSAWLQVFLLWFISPDSKWYILLSLFDIEIQSDTSFIIEPSYVKFHQVIYL